MDTNLRRNLMSTKGPLLEFMSSSKQLQKQKKDVRSSLFEATPFWLIARSKANKSTAWGPNKDSPCVCVCARVCVGVGVGVCVCFFFSVVPLWLA